MHRYNSNYIALTYFIQVEGRMYIDHGKSREEVKHQLQVIQYQAPEARIVRTIEQDKHSHKLTLKKFKHLWLHDNWFSYNETMEAADATHS